MPTMLSKEEVDHLLKEFGESSPKPERPKPLVQGAARPAPEAGAQRALRLRSLDSRVPVPSAAERKRKEQQALRQHVRSEIHSEVSALDDAIDELDGETETATIRRESGQAQKFSVRRLSQKKADPGSGLLQRSVLPRAPSAAKQARPAAQPAAQSAAQPAAQSAAKSAAKSATHPATQRAATHRTKGVPPNRAQQNIGERSGASAASARVTQETHTRPHASAPKTKPAARAKSQTSGVAAKSASSNLDSAEEGPLYDFSLLSEPSNPTQTSASESQSQNGADSMGTAAADDSTGTIHVALQSMFDRLDSVREDARAHGFEQGRKHGYEEGLKHGIEEGRLSALSDHDANLSHLVIQTREQIEHLLKATEEHRARTESGLIKLVLLVFERMFPSLARRYGEREILTFATTVVDTIQPDEQLTIVLPKDADQLRQKLEFELSQAGRQIRLATDDHLQSSECIIQWRDGKVARSLDEIWQQIAQIARDELSDLERT